MTRCRTGAGGRWNSKSKWATSPPSWKWCAAKGMAGRDCFVRREQVERWFDGVAAREKTLRVYDGAFHLLWHDWDKEVVLRDVAGWLDGRAAAR